MDGARTSDDRLPDLATGVEESGEEDTPTSSGLPADVASLFRRIGLHGMPYQDFSSVRRDQKLRETSDLAFQQSASEVAVADQIDVPLVEVPDAEARGSVAAAFVSHPVRLATSHQTAFEQESAAEGISLFLHVVPEREQSYDDMRPVRMPARRLPRTLLPFQERGSPEERHSGVGVSEGISQPGGTFWSQTSSVKPSPSDTQHAVEEYARSKPYATRAEDLDQVATEVDRERRSSEASHSEDFQRDGDSSPGMPSWIKRHARYARQTERSQPSAESLKKTRERVATRWYAFRGLLPSRVPDTQETAAEPKEEQPPLLAMFSLAGGAGKTSLAASLTRALAAQGERVLLVNKTDQDVLPFFFGAQGIRSGDRRVFAPPPGTMDAPIQLMEYAEAAEGDRASREDVQERLKRDGKGFSRIVVDLATAATEDAREVMRIGGSVLVPLLPDMSSLLSLRALRRTLGSEAKVAHAGGQLWFLLTRFDASQPLHLDVREVLEQELGEQLLPFVVRTSPAMAEALAQGMTVVDYAPGEGIAKDIQQAAAWVRTLIEPAREGLGQVRWSER